MIDRYIGICIESILNQTYKNLEIILVDDGGKDNCSDICDLYKSKDARIKVIHKQNGGLVSARKAGLQESNGSYISYVDGDDWIGPGFIEDLYRATDSGDYDMVCAGFTRDLFSKSASFLNAIPSGTYEGEKLRELWKNMISFGSYYRPGINTYVWNKLFRREIVLEAQSRVDNRISLGEDAAVTYPALLKCRKVAVTDNVEYHYRQREDSMLKQSSQYSADAQKLKYLHEYLKHWASSTETDLEIERQVDDYVLSISLIRSGGRLPHDDYSSFDPVHFGKKVVVYSAGTFGQQLMNRLKESDHCDVVAWIDDDYWEYRRCCLNVDPVENITDLEFDYILVATVDGMVAEKIKDRLADYGINREKMLTITVKKDNDELLAHFLDVEQIRQEEEKKGRGILSHA